MVLYSRGEAEVWYGEARGEGEGESMGMYELVGGMKSERNRRKTGMRVVEGIGVDAGRTSSRRERAHCPSTEA